MPTLAVYAEETAVPLVMQIGTLRQPVDLTGRTPRIILRRLDTNQRIDTNHTTVQTPPSAGRVQRFFQDGELVPGRIYVVECVVDYPDGQTSPDANEEDPLLLEVRQRRTTPVTP